MTERKSTEIKFRVTPSFKARSQAAAEAAGVSLSEFLVLAAEDRLSAGIAAWSPESHPAKSWMFQGFEEGEPETLLELDDPEHVEFVRRVAEEHGFPLSDWKPKIPQRRKEACSHSKPPYAFCSECDK